MQVDSEVRRALGQSASQASAPKSDLDIHSRHPQLARALHRSDGREKRSLGWDLQHRIPPGPNGSPRRLIDRAPVPRTARRQTVRQAHWALPTRPIHLGRARRRPPQGAVNRLSGMVISRYSGRRWSDLSVHRRITHGNSRPAARMKHRRCSNRYQREQPAGLKLPGQV